MIGAGNLGGKAGTYGKKALIRNCSILQHTSAVNNTLKAIMASDCTVLARLMFA